MVTPLPRSFPQHPSPSITPTGTAEPESFQPFSHLSWAPWHTALDMVASASSSSHSQGAPNAVQIDCAIRTPGDGRTLPTQASGSPVDRTLPNMAQREKTDTWAFFQQVHEGNNKGVLRYFLNDPSDPARNVSVIYNGNRHTWARTFMDDGANVDMMDDQVRLAIGAPLYPSNVTLSTSTKAASGILGVTPPITIEYGRGSNSIRVTRPFLVSSGMRSICDVLISNRDTQGMHGIIHACQCTYTLHTSGQDGNIVALTLPTTARST